MNTRARFSVACILLAAFLALGSTAARSASDVAASIGGVTQLTPGMRVVLLADPNDNPYHVAPPAEFSQAGIQSPRNATIVVNYIGSWDAQAQTAFQYAVDIWETQITSPVPIAIDARWSALGSGVLGAAGWIAAARDFAGAPQSGTWYPIALANKLYGSDLASTYADIGATFNSSFANWYFGTDGNPPSGKYDFVSVVLHELCHGLGFGGSMRVSGGQGSWGDQGYPYIYDRFAENGSGQSLLDTSLFPNPSAALAAQLTSGNIYFDAPVARAANGGSPVKLYAPSSWSTGSSYAHLDEIYNGTPNALMTYSIGAAESIHNPGAIARAMLQDTGLTIPGSNGSPTLAGLPDPTVPNTGTSSNVIDLWAYANDAEDADAALVFTISNSPDANAGVTIGSNRYIHISPSAGWTGTTDVTIQVKDTGNLTATDTFRVTVGSAAVCDFSDGFESGALGTGWTVYTTNEGRVRVATGYPHAGSYSVLLDDSVAASQYSTAAAVLAIDLSDRLNVTLDFWWREFSDESHPQDGVFISSDYGINWTQALSFNSGTGTYRNDVLDIDAIASSKGLTLNDHFLIKFQFYDDGAIDLDGYAFDDVQIACVGRLSDYVMYLPLAVRNWPPIVNRTFVASADDTSLLSAHGDTAYSSLSTLAVGYGPDPQLNTGVARSILRFDLSALPASAYIQKATLQPYLYYYAYRSGHSSLMSVSAHRVGQPWPGSPTWNNFATAFAESHGSVSVGTTFTRYSIDVTGLVRGWINGVWPNYGIMLRGQESGYDNLKRFYSANSTSSSRRPWLIVEYADPSGAIVTAVIPAEPPSDAEIGPPEDGGATLGDGWDYGTEK